MQLPRKYIQIKLSAWTRWLGIRAVVIAMPKWCRLPARVSTGFRLIVHDFDASMNRCQFSLFFGPTSIVEVSAYSMQFHLRVTDSQWWIEGLLNCLFLNHCRHRKHQQRQRNRYWIFCWRCQFSWNRKRADHATRQQPTATISPDT